MSTKTMKSPARASWKNLLEEAKRLRGQSGKAAHRRATILCELFDDSEFRAEVCAADDFKTESFLDELVEDLCVPFINLRTMLTEFPNVADWSDGKLATLLTKAHEQQASRVNREKPVVQRTVTRVTREQYEAAQDEAKDERARREFIEKRFHVAETEVEQLKRENQELRLENERLKGRIEQLERLTSTKAA